MRRTVYIRRLYVFAVVMAFVSCVMLVLPFFAVNAQNNIGSMTKIFNRNFEAYMVNNEFSSEIGKDFADYVSGDSLLKIVEADMSLDGTKSLAVNKGDFRWEQLDINKDSIAFRISIKIDEHFNNTLMLAVETQDTATNITGSGGTVISITNYIDDNGDREVILKNHEGKHLMKLSNDIRYKITVYFTKGSDKYEIVVEGNDGEENFVRQDNKFKSPLYLVNSMKLLVTENISSDQEVYTEEIDALPYVRLDNLEIYVKGRKYAQQYSSQVVGDNVDINLPVSDNTDNIKVFVNSTELYLQYPPKIRNNKVYIDAVTLYKCMGFDVAYDKLNAVYEMENDSVKISGTLSDVEILIENKLTNQKETLYVDRSPYAYDDTFFVSANFINETVNAKIWFDKTNKMFVITTGANKKSNMLTSINGMLYMNGEPYYEISFNKYDLFTQIMADYVENPDYPQESQRYEAAEAALAQLSRDGFKTIRVFCSSDALPGIMYNNDEMNTYLNAMDVMFQLCDKYNIKVVVCLNLISDIFTPKQYISQVGWISMDETIIELVNDENSISRQNMYKYLDKIINRYKDRDTILMWEIHNEANLEADIGSEVNEVRYSLLQLNKFYEDACAKIRQYDKSRVITSGDSMLRSAQWHLLQGVLKGFSQCDWNTDNFEERLKALWLVNEHIDVISTHTYSVGISGLSNDSVYIDQDNSLTQFGFNLLMKEAHVLSKPLYNGASVGTLDTSLVNYTEVNLNYLEEIVENGVQLTHWWTFRSDRTGYDDPASWRCDSGAVYEGIIDANRRLKELHGINDAQVDNTNNFWNDPYFEVVNESDIVNGQDFLKSLSFKNKMINFGIIAVTLVAAAIVVLIITTKITVKRNG